MPAMFAQFGSSVGLSIVAFLFVITIVVFFHELGHFLAARWCGVKVESFSIGFGREIIGFNDRKGTRWKLSWLPLGGYVKFAGDADVSSRPDEESMQTMDAETRAGVLHFKPLHQRAFVAAAGPIANFLLAIVMFSALFMWSGKPAEPPIIDQVLPGSAAAAAGLKQGDVIRSVGGQPVGAFADLQRIVSDSKGRPLPVGITRDGQEMIVQTTPEAVEITDPTGAKHSIGRLGITDAVVPVGPVQAVKAGVHQTGFIVAKTMEYLGQMAMGRASTSELSGPLGIAKVSGDVAQAGFVALLHLAALISVSIGLLNLFPIPVLDGGHLLYYAFEAVLGRPLGERAQELGFRLGLALVLCLMLLATFNDLVRFDIF